MRVSALVVAAAAACLPLSAVAQTEPTTTPPPAEAAVAVPVATTPVAAGKSWRDQVTMEGLVDGYFSYRPGGSGPSQGATAHIFDAPSESFVLAYTELALSVKPEPVGLRIDLGFGQVADFTASNSIYTDLNPTNNTAIEVLKHFQQAYASFALSKSLTLDFGKFVTSAGAEVIEAKGNWNYSRSFLFNYAIPFTLTGLRLTAPVSSALTVQAMLVNGWDQVFDDNRGKTLGLSVTFNAPTGTTLIFNGTAGPETNPPGVTDWRFLVDLVATQPLGPITLMANFDYGHQGPANWWGIAGYGRLTLMSYLNLSLRGELFKDAQGFRLGTGVNTRVEEVTATAGFPVGSNGELRAEFRGDFSSPGIYAVGTDTVSSQFQLLAAALAWF